MTANGAAEVTLRRNRAAFDELQLIPRVMRGITNADTACELFGRRLTAPILLAPTALARLVADEGELAVALGLPGTTVRHPMWTSSTAMRPDGGSWVNHTSTALPDATESRSTRPAGEPPSIDPTGEPQPARLSEGW